MSRKSSKFKNSLKPEKALSQNTLENERLRKALKEKELEILKRTIYDSQ